MIKFTEEQKQFIYKNYKGIGNKELTNKFNQKFNTNLDKQIYYFKRNHHLNSGLTGKFEKGHETFNKGKKWDEYIPKEKQENCRKTTFKKGNIPKNYRPIGSERITIDGFIEIKTANPNKWRIKSHVIYEEYYQTKIPKGYKIVYLDGNRLNLDPSNLKMVSCAEELLMNANNLRYDKKELTETGYLIAKIINKRGQIKNGRL